MAHRLLSEVIPTNLKDHPLPLDTVVIKRIHFVETVTRKRLREFRSSSLSGHLIHYVVEGEVEQECNGIKQTLNAGDMVWYEPNSIVKGVIKSAPWTFYTVGFDSPNLPYLSADRRTVKAPSSAAAAMRKLIRLWTARHQSSTQENLLISSCLYEIVAICFPKADGADLSTKGSSVWWEIESAYTQAIDSPPPSVAELATANQMTTKKLSELCKMTTGQSPKARLQTVRMAHMKGLLLLSDLTISEVAYHVGFQRVQDLSRACKEFFGMTPLEMRRSQQVVDELP